MKPENQEDIARAVERGQQRAGFKSSLGSGIVLLGVCAAFLVGGLAGSAMVGLLVFVASIVAGIWVTYR